MIANIVDLRDRALTQDGVILLTQFDVPIEPVRTTDDARVSSIWEEIDGVSFILLRDQCDQALQDSFAYRSEALWAEHHDGILSNPELAMIVHLTTVHPDQLSSSLTTWRTTQGWPKVRLLPVLRGAV